MDVLRPQTIRVAGRCYRVLNPQTTTSTTNYAEADTYSYGECAGQVLHSRIKGNGYYGWLYGGLGREERVYD